MGRQARLKKQRRELRDHDQAVDQLVTEQRTDTVPELRVPDHDQAIAFISNGLGQTGIITSSGELQYDQFQLDPRPDPRDHSPEP